MATVWTYPPEILALELRTKDAALAVAAELLRNIVVRSHLPV